VKPCSLTFRRHLARRPLANGVVEAAHKTKIKLPWVLRLERTTVEQGREILQKSGLNFIVGQDMQTPPKKSWRRQASDKVVKIGAVLLWLWRLWLVRACIPELVPNPGNCQITSPDKTFE